MPEPGDDRLTRVIGSDGLRAAEGVLLLRILNGPLAGGEAILLGDAPFVIGASFEATLRLPDPAVSRRHLELVNRGGYVAARDLGSTNGSWCDGRRFESLELGPGAVFKVGETELQLVAPGESSPLPPSQATAFGPLLGRSRRMRELFAGLERAAKSDATVLVTGETGTGKEVVAEAIHQASRRARGPLVVVDCASIPETLIESELFGHVRGAYTNAIADRTGAFEAAHGGTLFLDELGELPPALQPRLLRALETRRVKRIGENLQRPVDVRVIAATNRDLEAEVRARRFRSDLYFRLAVVRVALPPLRERREDIPLLAEAFLARYVERNGGSLLRLAPDVLAALSSHDWPGNVRELRNVIEQASSVSSGSLDLALRLRGASVGIAPARASAGDFAAFLDRPLKEARRAVLDAFERAYAEHALGRAGGNVTKAAELAQVHRNVLHRILAGPRVASGSADGDPLLANAPVDLDEGTEDS